MDQLTVTSTKTPEAATSGVFVCLWTISTFLSYISLDPISLHKSIPNFFNHVLTFLSLFYTSIYGVSQANMIKLSRCRTSSRKEAVFIDYINTFLVSVAASIVGYYVCKWLDRDNRQ